MRLVPVVEDISGALKSMNGSAGLEEVDASKENRSSKAFIPAEELAVEVVAG